MRLVSTTLKDAIADRKERTVQISVPGSRGTIMFMKLCGKNLPINLIRLCYNLEPVNSPYNIGVWYKVRE